MARKKLLTENQQIKKRKWKKEQIFAFIVASVPLVGFIVFNGFPLLISFIGMFSNVDLYDLTNIQWNNFEGFKSVFIPGHAYELFYFDLSKYFYKALIITVWIASAQLVTLAIALLIATLLHQKPKGAKMFQILFFVPYICSTVAVSLMWRWMFASDGGILNAILGTNIDWLRDPSTITWTIIAAVIWQAPGYGIVMFKAALDAINPALYEASEIDGANAWKQFWHITIPSVSPTTFYLLFASVLTGLTMFDRATLMAPVSWTQTAGYKDMGLTLMYYVYILGTQRMEMELASVVSIVLFVVTLTLSVIIMKKRNEKVEG